MGALRSICCLLFAGLALTACQTARNEPPVAAAPQVTAPDPAPLAAPAPTAARAAAG